MWLETVENAGLYNARLHHGMNIQRNIHINLQIRINIHKVNNISEDNTLLYE